MNIVDKTGVWGTDYRPETVGFGDPGVPFFRFYENFFFRFCEIFSFSDFRGTFCFSDFTRIFGFLVFPEKTEKPICNDLRHICDLVNFSEDRYGYNDLQHICDLIKIVKKVITLSITITNSINTHKTYKPLRAEKYIEGEIGVIISGYFLRAYIIETRLQEFMEQPIEATVLYD
jgi:hypothetical protein